MRVTIVRPDGFVSVDQEGYTCDLSFMRQEVHAVQWYDIEGEVEIKDSRGRVVRNEVITSLDEFQPALAAWRAVKEESVRQAAEQSSGGSELDGMPAQG
jgi:hypothetical protein